MNANIYSCYQFLLSLSKLLSSVTIFYYVNRLSALTLTDELKQTIGCNVLAKSHSYADQPHGRYAAIVLAASRSIGCYSTLPCFGI